VLAGLAPSCKRLLSILRRAWRQNEMSKAPILQFFDKLAMEFFDGDFTMKILLFISKMSIWIIGEK
jgi:hypothetical protein